MRSVGVDAEKVALVTGVAGQDGVYLSRLLLGHGYRVVGVARAIAASETVNAYLHGVEVVELDLRDSAGMDALVSRVCPSEIYNLGAFSSVGDSWGEAEAVAEINGMAVLRLLETLLRFRDTHGWAPRLYQASSSEMFGLARQQPQHEETAHHPRSPYAAAKSFAHNLAVNYRESYGLYVCAGILYNHESPLRPERFVSRKITKGVAEIALGMRTEITLGNMEVRRDWGAARDYVQAMWLMMQQTSPDDFIIATGVSRPLIEVAREALAAVGIEDVGKYVRSDPALQRPVDVPELRGNSSKAVHLLGWRPEQSFSELMSHMVWADIDRIQSGEAESLRLLEPANAFRPSSRRRPLTTNHDRQLP